MPWRIPPLPLVCLVMLLMAGASTASAQRRGPPTATSTSTQDPAPESAPATDPEVERLARELFEQGRDAYANGQFAEARDLFQHSYDLSGRPGLLYNIAQASERMRDDQHALDVYRAYLEAVPDAPERDFVEARIVFLQERVRAQRESTAEESAKPRSGTPARGPGGRRQWACRRWRTALGPGHPWAQSGGRRTRRERLRGRSWRW
jgi:hypothetical protein